MTASHPRSRGFTLIELMCSMAIGMVILLAAAAMLGSSGDGYDRIGGSVASEREARALITQLATDLKTARFHKDEVIETASATWPRHRLGFLTLQPSQAQTKEGRIGDLCSVRYYVRDLAIGGRKVRCLMRGFNESDETFKALRNERVGPLFDEPDSADPENPDEPVAFGVVSFEARPKTRNAEGKWIDWVKNDTTPPDGLEVKLVIARRDLASKLKESSDWDGTGSAGKLLGKPDKADENKNLEIYGTILRFGNHATS